MVTATVVTAIGTIVTGAIGVMTAETTAMMIVAATGTETGRLPPAVIVTGGMTGRRGLLSLRKLRSRSRRWVHLNESLSTLVRGSPFRHPQCHRRLLFQNFVGANKFAFLEGEDGDSAPDSDE